MAEKLNLGRDFAKYFDVTERVKRGDQYMGEAALFNFSCANSLLICICCDRAPLGWEGQSL